MTRECTHARLRAITPGNRCPLCQPLGGALGSLDLAIAPQREVRHDALLTLGDGTPVALSAVENEVRARQLAAIQGRPRDPLPPVGTARYISEAEREKILAEIQAINREIQEAEQLLAVSDAAECLADFGTFYRRGWHEIDTSGREFVENPGTDAIIQHLQALGDRRITLLGIACSPGFGKSSAASVAFPAWMWARDPSWRAICASHAFELAQDIARRRHRLITGDWYRTSFPHVDVVGEALKAMATSRGGMHYAVGVGGALTGLRGDAGLIDDSLNAIDAGSKQAVRAVNQWFEEAFSTRFDARRGRPPIGVIQQRLAEDDLIDLVRRLGGEILELAARFDPNRRSRTSIWVDPRVEPDELLAPEVHSKEYLEERERIMGARAFAGQYDQRIAPKEGNTFKVGMWSWFSLTDDVERVRPRGAREGVPLSTPRDPRTGAPVFDWSCLSIDATGGSTSEDASALGLGLVCGRANRRFVVHDYTDGPAGWTETLRRIERAIRHAGQILVKQKKLVVLVEKKAMGASEGAPLPTQIRAMIAGEAVRPDGSRIPPFEWSDGSRMGVKLELYEPTGKGSKEQRAQAMEVEVETGLVALLDGAEWVPAYVEEMGLFPLGTRDDRVDYTSQVLDHYRESKSSFLAAAKRRGR